LLNAAAGFPWAATVLNDSAATIRFNALPDSTWLGRMLVVTQFIGRFHDFIDGVSGQPDHPRRDAAHPRIAHGGDDREIALDRYRELLADLVA